MAAVEQFTAFAAARLVRQAKEVFSPGDRDGSPLSPADTAEIVRRHNLWRVLSIRIASIQSRWSAGDRADRDCLTEFLASDPSRWELEFSSENGDFRTVTSRRIVAATRLNRHGEPSATRLTLSWVETADGEVRELRFDGATKQNCGQGGQQ